MIDNIINLLSNKFDFLKSLLSSRNSKILYDMLYQYIKLKVQTDNLESIDIIVEKLDEKFKNSYKKKKLISKYRSNLLCFFIISQNILFTIGYLNNDKYLLLLIINLYMLQNIISFEFGENYSYNKDIILFVKTFIDSIF